MDLTTRNDDDLDGLRQDLELLERTAGALALAPEIKARAAADPVLDELCGPTQTKAAGRPSDFGMRAGDLRALGEEAIRLADNTPSDNNTVGGTSVAHVATGLKKAGLRAPENKALRRPSGIAGARARRLDAYDALQRAKHRTGLGSRDPHKAATLAIGKEVVDLKRRISAAEVKRDRPPGMASRFPGIDRGAGGPNSHYKALHRAAVKSWMRSGRQDFQGHHIADLQKKALGLVGESNPDGGFFVLSDRVNNPLDARLIELSLMRQHATVRSIVGDALEQPVNKKGTKAYWRSEREGRAIKTGVDGAFPATDDDAAAMLIDLQYSIKSAYLPTAKWWMNRATAARIRKLRDQQGRFLWAEGLQPGQPPMLLGHEIVLDEYVPSIGSNSISLGFLDFARTYVVVDRVGVRVLRDPYTNRPWVKFATTKRVGGAVQMFDAAAFLQFSA